MLGCTAAGEDTTEMSTTLDTGALLDTDTDTDTDTWWTDAYEPIEWTREPTGHISVTLQTPAGPTRFYLDTAASVEVIDDDLAAALGLNAVLGDFTTVSDFESNEIPFPDFQAVVADLGPPGTELAGILGTNFLLQQNAILDYRTDTLFVGDGSSSPRERLGDELSDANFSRISLDIDLINFLTLEGELDGMGPLHVVVDTGAPSAIVTLSAAEFLDLELEKTDINVATVGGEVDTFVTATESLTLGELQVPWSELLVLDLSNINDQLAAVGLPEIDLLVGNDLLFSRDAVVDYSGSDLWLQR